MDVSREMYCDFSFTSKMFRRFIETLTCETNGRTLMQKGSALSLEKLANVTFSILLLSGETFAMLIGHGEIYLKT